MIRPLTIADAIRIAALREPDWAVRPMGAAVEGRHLFSPAHFLWGHLRARPRGSAWIDTKGMKASSLASARPRSGPTAWIVDHLVTSQGDEVPCCALLETAAVHAARQGAERLFLQLPDERHMVETVRHSGFVPCTQVLLLTLVGRTPLLSTEPAQGLRRRTPQDDHPLFRLYNATTPASVRSGIGVTLQQWKDAQEPRWKGTRELVLEEGDGVKGWLRLDQHRRWATVRLSVQPDWGGDLRSLVALVLKENGTRSVWWEIPESQEGLRLVLERVGFEVAGSYQLMVKSMVARVKEPVLVAAPTSG